MGQADNFISLLHDLGGRGIHLPSIEILPVKHSSQLENLAPQLTSFHIIIFISPNAAKNSITWFEKSLKSTNIGKIACIGKGTQKTLHTLNIGVDLCPDTLFNSEALLKLSEFDKEKINNKTILIIKGEGGRTFLADTLIKRGAKVETADVYRRQVPNTDTQPFIELFANHQIQWTTVTSNEALKNLYHMLNKQGQAQLLQTQLIVASHSCQQLAQQLGFKQIFQAQSATDLDMLNTIKQNIHL